MIPVVAVISIRSPFNNTPVGSVIVAVNAGLIGMVIPLPALISVGEKVPLNVTFATGLLTVLKISWPWKDMPSEASEKYDAPNVSVDPDVKLTVRLKLDRVTGVVTGKSGAELFVPV
jgi:hypothetical protein